MAHQLSSPPLIKEINGIVRRSPNEVNYSTLIEKKIEARKQLENEIQQYLKRFGISGKMTKDAKQEDNASKIKILNSKVNENAIDMMENKEEDDGEQNHINAGKQL